MPINDSRYALFERFRGIIGNIASTATTNTQALTENCMVCRSQRMEVGAGVGVGPEVADAPDVLVADPELRARGCSLAADDDDEDEDELPVDIASTTSSGSIKRW